MSDRYYSSLKEDEPPELSPAYDDVEFCPTCERYNKNANISVSTFHHPSECPFYASKIEARIINGEKPLDKALREVMEKFPLKV